MTGQENRQRPKFRALGLAVVALIALGVVALSDFSDPALALSEQGPGPTHLELTWREKAWLAKHQNIRVGAETNYPPYEFKDSDGRFTGIIADYLDFIRHRVDANFQVSQLRDFATVEEKLRKRELDVILALAPSTEREQFLIFTKPYLHYVNVIVTRDNFGFVSSLRDFAENRVAVVEGHSSKQLAARVYPNYNVASYPDLLEGLLAVSTGKIDGLIDDIFPIVYMIRQRRINNLKIATAVDKSLQPLGFAVGVRKDWPELASILDKVLAGIGHEQEREISQKWLSVRYENKVDYRAIWTSVIVFSAILLAAILWIRQLSGQRRALMAARSEAEAANRAKDHFLANMSHELRTPLHAILGYADLVREGKLAEPARREALATIARSGQHLLSLINDVLDLSRIRSGHLELVPAPVHLRALFEEIAAMVRVDAQQKGLDFFLQVSSDLPPVVQVDGRRLRQILLNLLGNAIKFTETGSVTLVVAATPLNDDQIELHVSVQDTGIGIAPKDLARIFAPFEQAGEGQRRESGAGLGLAISRELTASMGGRIEVDSRPGGGSDFRFWLLLPVVHEQQPVVPAAARIAGYEGRRLTVLAVDDQPENRMLLRQMLEPIGFEVMLVADGQEAVAAARKRAPDLIVMDLRMPGTNGFDAAHAIRRSHGLQGVAIIAASASSADLERAEADHDTFSACLRKPFQTSDLLDVIGHVLAPRWHYVQPQASDIVEKPAAQAEMVVPARSTLDELLELARMGMLVRVEQIALDLERRDARYQAFARRVYTLAHNFEEEALIVLLQRCLGAHSDATAD
jgi:signal transduction histidine kinase/DNA-binding response OmpR family regulator